MLIGGQSEFTLVNTGNLLETSLELVSGRVLDTTVLDKHGEVPLSIVTLLPAVGVGVVRELERSGRLEWLAHSSLDVGLESGNSHPVDSVLQSLTISTVIQPK